MGSVHHLISHILIITFNTLICISSNKGNFTIKYFVNDSILFYKNSYLLPCLIQLQSTSIDKINPLSLENYLTNKSHFPVSLPKPLHLIYINAHTHTHTYIYDNPTPILFSLPTYPSCILNGQLSFLYILFPKCGEYKHPKTHTVNKLYQFAY